jgi:hypothetical protein
MTHAVAVSSTRPGISHLPGSKDKETTFGAVCPWKTASCCRLDTPQSL